MKDAIEKAIKVGWRPNCLKFYERHLLDPLFWQALGKALEWEGEVWKYEWHLFTDHLAEGKDTDSFFAALLTQSNKQQ